MRRLWVTVFLAGLALGCDEDADPRPPPTPDTGSADAGELDGGGGDAGPVCADGPRKPIPLTRSFIVNGTRQPTQVPLLAAQQNAVVGVGTTSDFAASCSGTLIADRVVLTATHCTEGVAPSSLLVYFGPDDFDPDLVLTVASKLEHPVEDLALLTLSSAPAAEIDVAPIPIYLGTLTRDDEGAIVEQAGYGDTESSESGRFFVTETLYFVDDTTFVVDGEGMRGVCFGDSGGPSMIVAPEGDARVIGDLSEGDAECGNQDVFVRADVQRAWIETVTGPTPTAGPIGCGATTSVGGCEADGRTATFCESGTLTREPCTTDQVCGWSISRSAWRCVQRAQDPCGGLAQVGACDGQVARWCDRGQVLQRDCASCGETCLYLGARRGYDCDPDPLACGDLDYLGHCTGNVSEWCGEEDRREVLDCAAQSEVCRFVDNETGYYCAPP